MIRSNLHTHTTFSDGKNSPEEMILRAKELSFTSLGFSDHSEKMMPCTFYPSKENVEEYRKAISELSCKYQGEIDIFCGIEQDSMMEIDPSLFDYTIGSVHYISVCDEMIPIDLFPEDQLSFIEKHGRGEKMELARRYYDRVVTFAQKGEYDILGHFDLVNKFSFFDENDPVYQDLATQALEEALSCVPYIEVNTGAISRGYRTTPYPASFLLPVMKKRNAKIVISSDAHFAAGLDCFFDQTVEILKENGFTTYFQKTRDGFEEIPLLIE